jgi:hypothetical protein
MKDRPVRTRIGTPAPGEWLHFARGRWNGQTPPPIATAAAAGACANDERPVLGAFREGEEGV